MPVRHVQQFDAAPVLRSSHPATAAPLTGRRLILVTGAPRSGTTPVGNMLSKCLSVVSLYEPLGPTGLASISGRFPVVGDNSGLDEERLSRLADDLAAFRFGDLKPQARGGRSPTIFTHLFGSRTLHSFRLARLQPWSRTAVWKDPHAIFLAPDLAEAGLPVVVTARTARAHAASYKRLGWRFDAQDAYPRWSARFGACRTCEHFLPDSEDKVVSAALLWRMSYLPLIRAGTLDRVELVTSGDLERDEAGTYRRLCQALDLTPTSAFRRALAKPRRDAAAGDLARKTHDWNRSVASLNNYWKSVLSDGDIAKVDRITSDVMPHLFRS